MNISIVTKLLTTSLIFIHLITGYASAQETNYSIEPIASNLYVPWSIVFTSNDRMLVSERDGTIVEINRHVDKWISHDLYIFDNVSEKSEAGLMGLAIDPDYDTNSYIYVMHSYQSNGNLTARIVRFVDNNSKLIQDKIILDNIPCAQFHCGGRIAFGPDKKLYVTVGDAREPKLAQDTSLLHGSILRVNSDGSIPNDNPLPSSAIYSYGHRNPQGLSWHPETNMLFSSEHGPSGIDGIGGGDEINIIIPEGNYGWPEISHRESRNGFIDPVYLFSPDGPPAVAPASAHIVQNKNNSWYGDLLIGGLYEGDIIRCRIDYDQVLECNNLGLSVGRIRDISESPDGSLYFSTSNRDGRNTKNGKVVSNADDVIYLLHLNDEGSQNNKADSPEYSEKSFSFLDKLFNLITTPLSYMMGLFRGY